ncbi:MAG: S-adenosyl-methyltransferase [Flavobacteriaceae bacterium]|nr:S-adenosyl-methyltransferase [Flavobacteriaceae bacterium]
MTNNKSKIYTILRGGFLTEDNAQKNWVFIIFLAVLALVMIAISHSVDKKVQEIGALNKKNKELRSAFVANRSELMNLKMESSITKALAIKGLKAPTTPPYKIKVIVN